ncbi:MAG: iron-containing alcohol dehydrogenase [Bryobacteraceae bacterium]|nr:iron-containing alcohol dehydrogenase [Bryobacteraceae bacterium]
MFEFATAARIVFGPGSLREVAPAAAEMGRRALVVTGRETRRAAALIKSLDSNSVSSFAFPTPGEPDIDLVRDGVENARQERCDVVIAFGGGSAIDAAKAIAALLANPGDPLDYLEVVGKGNKLPAPSAPFIAVPTTAGTGSEVTRNAVLGSPAHKVKASLRSPRMLARLAVVDPELTLDLPPTVTASTGLDALTQLIEPYVSVRANPMTDMFCLEGIRRAARSLPRAFSHPGDLEARTDMAFAGLLGGLSLANAGLGAVHGFAAPIGGEFPAPHGAVCAALLPHVIDANVQALKSRDAGGEALRRYAAVAAILTGDSTAAPEDAARWTARIVSELSIPPLRTYGLAEPHVPALIDKAARASSMKGNPIALASSELREILTRAL